MATSFEVVRGANGNPRTPSPEEHSETEETRETRNPMPMPMRSPKLNIHNTCFRGGGDTWVTPEYSPKIHARAPR